MTEFRVEHEFRTYVCRYRVEADLTIVVTAAGRTRRVPLQEMRPTKEAVAVAKQLIAVPAPQQVRWDPVGALAPDPVHVKARPSLKQGSSASIIG